MKQPILTSILHVFSGLFRRGGGVAALFKDVYQCKQVSVGKGGEKRITFTRVTVIEKLLCVLLLFKVIFKICDCTFNPVVFCWSWTRRKLSEPLTIQWGKYLKHCRFFKFSLFQRKERSVIFIVGTPQLWEKKIQKITSYDFWIINFNFIAWNKYLITYQPAIILALTDLLVCL